MTIKDKIDLKIGSDTEQVVSLFNRRFPSNDSSTELSVVARPLDYSASAIARAVEDCNAHLLNLNITDRRTEEGNLIVDLRVDHINGEPVARSLERYGFEVIDYTPAGADSFDSARERANEILHILDL